MLATRLILEQGIEVVGICFATPFFSGERGSRSAAALGIPVHPFDITGEFIEILKHPVYGYGKNCNPCTDCHRLMISTAGRRMEELGASFIITGEVIGQRPKSQTRDALNAVAGGVPKGFLLRPLSARLLGETIPEKEGWVDRTKLLGISGRSRKIQFALAKRYGLKGYSSPGGGCLLTESGFCRKLMELKEREGWEVDDLELLRVGRHFRLPSGAKVVSGRDELENLILEKLARGDDYLFQASARPGSLILLRKSGEVSPEDRATAAAICVRYSKEKEGRVEIGCRKGSGKGEGSMVTAHRLPADRLEQIRII